MTFKQLIDFQKENTQTWLINLGFEKCLDMRSSIDFLPIIYQERSAIRTHHLLIFDIEKMRVVRQTSIISNLSVRNHLRKSCAGFGEYTITRTSDAFN